MENTNLKAYEVEELERHTPPTKDGEDKSWRKKTINKRALFVRLAKTFFLSLCVSLERFG
jgi:hypothetical protein